MNTTWGTGENYKRFNIHIPGVPPGKRKGRAEEIFEKIMSEPLPVPGLLKDKANK